MVMMVVMVMLVLILVIVVMVMMVMLMFILVIIVIMVMMVMLVFVLVILVTMVMVMMLMLFFILVMVMVVMMVRVLRCQRLQVAVERIAVIHRCEDIAAGQFIPRSCDHDRVRVVLFDERKRGVEFRLIEILRAAEDHAARGFDLVVEELTEILMIDLCLFRVHDGYAAAEHNVIIQNRTDRGFHIGQLADAGRLDQDMVGMKLRQNFLQSLGKVTDQGAADAARVHFRDLDPGVLQKGAVDSDLAEFILDQNNLLSCICFTDQFLDQGRFAGSQKSAEYVNFRHCFSSFTAAQNQGGRSAFFS